MPSPVPLRLAACLALAASLLFGTPGTAAPSEAGRIAFVQGVAEAVPGNEAIAAFYRGRDYRPIFTGPGDLERRAALLRSLETASAHGLPSRRYDAAELETAFRNARSPRDLGRAEALAASMFVSYARDMHSGALTPQRVDSGILRSLPREDPGERLRDFARSDPAAYLRALPPRTPQYAALFAEKMRLERVVARGGWGAEIAADTLKPGQSGAAVVRLRNRLIAMGYLGRNASGSYDPALQAAVQTFQSDHGLTPDGIAGKATIAALDVSAETRLGQVIVAMERERWSNVPRGERHILVNIPEFTARIVEHGKETFSTRVVVGKNTPDRRTPEFSDQMEFMVVNPSWSVPRSIATKEYLPKLQRNPNAVSHLKLVDSRGRAIDRGSVNFAAYTPKTFPFRLRQAPSKQNALGQVKFMFPNAHNIYLHDTPSKSLFDRDRRDFSHGCIRVGRPFDLAYALLARQSDDPKALFQSRLRSGAESRITLKEPLPVHIIYRTAFAPAKGRMNYREDVYGRDARIWEALQKAGVSLPAAGS